MNTSIQSNIFEHESKNKKNHNSNTNTHKVKQSIVNTIKDKEGKFE